AAAVCHPHAQLMIGRLSQSCKQRFPERQVEGDSSMMKSKLMLFPMILATAGYAAAQPSASECADTKAQLTRAETRLKDWPQLARYHDANAKVTAPAKNEARVVFMGDSITDSWQNPKFGGFFSGKPYVDRGISGQTTPQMLVRFRADVIALHP